MALALEYKQLPYNSHMLSLSKGETQTPTYLSLNPHGKVPTLKDGETVVYESLAILHYIDGKSTERPLFGTSHAEASKVIQTVCEIDHYVLGVAVPEFVRPIFGNRIEGREEAAQQAAQKVHSQLARFAQRLQDHDWLVTETPCAADFALYPALQVIQRALQKPTGQALKLGFLPWESTYPALHAWTQRIEAIEGYDNTYPPHWR